MADFSVRSDHIDVEQIMRQIRARVRDKRGADYTEAEIRELANVKLDKFLDPKAVRSDLLLHYRQQRRPANEAPMPLYAFDPSIVYNSDRGTPGRILTFIRKLLNPILKLFFNPSPLLHVVHLQTQINDRVNKALVTREEFDALNFEMFNNLVVELTRLGIEVRNLRMQVESFGTRLDFDERRARALEGAVQYKPGAPVQRPPQPQQAAAAAGAGAGASEEGPAAGGDDEDAAGEGGESGRARRRRRRRGRRRGQGGEGDASEGQGQGPQAQSPQGQGSQGQSPQGHGQPYQQGQQTHGGGQGQRAREASAPYGSGQQTARQQQPQAQTPRAEAPRQETRVTAIDTPSEEPATQPFVPEPAAAAPQEDAHASFWAAIESQAPTTMPSDAAASTPEPVEPSEPEPPARQWHRVTSEPETAAAAETAATEASASDTPSPWPLADNPEPESVPPGGHWPEADPSEDEHTHAHPADASAAPTSDASSAPDRIVSHTDDGPDEPSRS